MASQTILALVLFLSATGAAAEGRPGSCLEIEEFLAANRSGLLDRDGDAEDWFEIVNRDSVPIRLGGFSATDDPDDPGKWVFPDFTLKPGDRFVVFASGKDRSSPFGQLHTNFKINPDGEYLALYSDETPRRLLSAFVDFPSQRADVSYGVDALGKRGYFLTPTPLAPNDQAVALPGAAAAPEASPARGLHDSHPLDVTLDSADPEARIFYTLDGSEPTEAGGTLYTGALALEPPAERGAVTLRAIAVRAGYLPSRVSTFTYVFPSLVLEQAELPEGFPERWNNAPGVDYGVDPRIAGDARRRDDLLASLRELPTLSIVMDVEDLFGTFGIYANPIGEGVVWERAASVEYFEAEGDEGEGFQIDCGARIHGGASRLPIQSPKHSIRLLFRGAHGPTRLRYPIFADSPVQTFDTLVLRSNFNNSWINARRDERERAQLNRDQWARDVQLAMSGLASHGNFVHLYLNGLYWGVYNPTERPGAPFAAAQLGGRRRDYDILSGRDLVDGDLRAWETMQEIAARGIASRGDFEDLQDYLDLPSFIDYMLLNFYCGNTDWPHRNWYAVRQRLKGAGFRFISWDAERILEELREDRTAVENLNSSASLYSALRESPEFRLRFADRAHRHLTGSGVLTPEAARALWLRRSRRLERAVIAESARWGDYREKVHSYLEPPYVLYTPEDYRAEERRLLDEYFPSRTEIVLDQLRSADLYPTVSAPTFDPPGGIAPVSGIAIQSTDGDAVYYTLDGSDPRVEWSGEVSATARLADSPVLVEGFARVRARARRGEIWSALAESAFGEVAQRSELVISEIHYHPRGGSELEFVELHNPLDVAVPLDGLEFTQGIRCRFLPGDLMAPGEYRVIAANADVLALRHPALAIGGSYVGQLDNDGERLTLEDRGRIVFSVDYDDSAFWPVAADGFGHSLVRVAPELDPDDPRAWRASLEPGGSPGLGESGSEFGDLLISEVLASALDPAENFVEIYNPGERELALDGWALGTSRDDLAALQRVGIPDGILVPARGYRALTAAELVPDAPASLGLDPHGGSVYLSLLDRNGEFTGIIVGASFGAAEPGRSFGIHATSTGTDFVALERPSPGEASAAPRTVALAINELHYHPASEDGLEFVELYNPGPEGLDVSGWRLGGVGGAENEGFVLPPGTLAPARGFVLAVPVSPEAFAAASEPPLDDAVVVVGPYAGALDNGGERLRLSRPLEDADGVFIEVDKVVFDDRPPWPTEADGGGPSLERIRAREHGNDVANWLASIAAGGSPGRPNSVSPPQGGRQLPGDVNQDRRLDLSDPVGMLEFLFLGTFRLPCDGGSIDGEGNRLLIDANGSGPGDISDVVHVLHFLFVGGPPHALGSECAEIPGCPENCEG